MSPAVTRSPPISTAWRTRPTARRSSRRRSRTASRGRRLERLLPAVISHRHPDDGQFRELLAKVKRPGAIVRARKGYWTASPDEALRTALLAKAAEPKIVVPPEPPPHASPLIRPWFGIARGENGKTRVTFVWEPASHVPGDRVRRTVSKLDVPGAGGRRHGPFEGPVLPTGPAAVDDPATAPARVVFDVAARTPAVADVD